MDNPLSRHTWEIERILNEGAELSQQQSQLFDLYSAAKDDERDVCVTALIFELLMTRKRRSLETPVTHESNHQTTRPMRDADEVAAAVMRMMPRISLNACILGDITMGELALLAVIWLTGRPVCTGETPAE